MDDKKARFLARLRETFRVEASEHLEAISAGLLAIERASDDERAVIVERIFREAHSLKGAARSVSLTSVEALCVDLESVFAAMKRGDLVLSTEVLDVIHPALGLLAALCARPDSPPSAENKEKEQRAVAGLKRIAANPPERVEAAIVAANPPERVEASIVAANPPERVEAAIAVTVPARAIPQEDVVVASSVRAAGPDTVRISTQKISAILQEAEELVGAKIAASERAAALSALALELASWNQQHVRRASQKKAAYQGKVAAAELFDAEMLFTRTLENTLRKLASAAHQDARSLVAISDRLLEDTKKALLLPCSYLLGTMPGIVRDLAREQGKEVDLRVSGEDIEIDRRVLDELKAPLIHLLRNFVDHGIEQPDVRRATGKPTRGSITIAVSSIEGNRVELAIGDDGAGIDATKVRKAAVRLGIITADEAPQTSADDVLGLIFHSGLSTSPIITDLSGRGLGLAIVREKIDKLGGSVTVDSRLGVGTTFRMQAPLSLATFRGVLVEAAGRSFVFPTANVVRVCRVNPDELKTVENRQTLKMDDRAMSFVRLRDVLELTGLDDRDSSAARSVVVARAAGREVAFQVDAVVGEQEVMVKSLGRQLLRVRNIAGASIGSSGAVIPILNVVDLVESASTAGLPEQSDSENVLRPGTRERVLIAEDSITSRTLVKSILEGAGYEVVATVDGMDALTRLKTESFDLVVSDVDMPRMNGFELTAKIRADKKLSELPVVLVTALGSQKDREYGIEVGANAYIVKSDFDQSNLLQIIRRLL